jgi:restriction system protein
MHDMNDRTEKIVQVGQVSETDTALPITTEGKIVRLGQVTETDTALPINVLKRFAQEPIPGVLLQAILTPGDPTEEGRLIEAVALPWFQIIEMIQRDPDVVYKLDWRQWEEIIAGAYRQQGFDVVLTPRSNDKGRDVIATSRGIGSIRYFDQVKAYNPKRLVTAEEVRALVGVLTLEGNVSKAILTTTSDFAPGILRDENIKRFIPYRLELKPKQALLDWLASLARRN